MSKPKKAIETGRTPMDSALRFLGARARTIREVERHLDACEYGEVEVYETVERLKELRLDVPQVTLLAYELKKRGLPVPDGILTRKELVDVLTRIYAQQT